MSVSCAGDHERLGKELPGGREALAQALAAVRFEKGLMGLLVALLLVGGTGLHGREEVNQPGLRVLCRENRLHPILLSRPFIKPC